ncbi:MAG: hypothetical protein MJ164_03165 [Alphaproteobacteria bacterium]|nr:hypothetical protein [Alphaproteobacteria bacterium]
MRTLTKTGIRILSAKYRSILIKCAIINASVFIGAFGAGSAMAVEPSAYTLTEVEETGNWNYYDIVDGVKTYYSITPLSTNTNHYTIAPEGTTDFTIRSNTGTDSYHVTVPGTASSELRGSLSGNVGSGTAQLLYFDQNNTDANIFDAGAITNLNDANNYDIYADFVSNHTATYGGAIRNGGDNSTTAKIYIINGDFVINQSGYNNSRGNGGPGGAIVNGVNSSNATIDIIQGNFIGNQAHKDSGGAIMNQHLIGTITGDFLANSANSSFGGVISNIGDDSVIDSINGNFVSNLVTTVDSNWPGVGGAIYNGGTINNIDGDFILNSAEKLGGAIKNSGTINKINGGFILNSAVQGGAIRNSIDKPAQEAGGAITIANITGNFIGNHAEDNGGAIYNNSSGQITEIIGDFIDNAVTNYAGGAVYNLGQITGITGKFKNNSAGSTGQYAFGGAIYNSEGTIGTITGVADESGEIIAFEGNTTGTAGGAIYNNSSGQITEIIGDFNNNKTTNLAGGAIYNLGQITSITGKFKNNSAGSTGSEIYEIGGAIYNSEGTIGTITGVADESGEIVAFEGNTVGRNGGAVYNEATGTINNIIGSFKANSAGFNGGAIYNAGTIGVVALNDNIVFDGNYVKTQAGKGGAIYNNDSGDIVNLFATEGKRITFVGGENDTTNNKYDIDGIYNGGVLNINGDGVITTPYLGTVELYNVNGSGTTNVYGGTVVIDGAFTQAQLSVYNNAQIIVNNINNILTTPFVTLDNSYLSFGMDAVTQTGPIENLGLFNATLDLQNNSIATLEINDFNFGEQNNNLMIDADLAGENMDKLSITSIMAWDDLATLNISDIRLLSDATQDKVSLGLFADETTKSLLADKVTGNLNGLTFSPIYKYDALYDPTRGQVDFTRYNNGGYDDLNPAVMAGAVAAQVGGYLNQINSYENAFEHMDSYMMLSRNNRLGTSLAVKYITDAPRRAWLKPYAAFETVKLKHGPKVDNNMYGSFAGLDSAIVKLKHGWDIVYSGYASYDGSNQKYDGNSIYQNGGHLGATLSLYKGNFFTGLTANAGASSVKLSTMDGADDTTMFTTGAASKTGYDLELVQDWLIVQPSVLLSYSLVNMSDYTNASGVKISSDALHAIQIAPELKLISNLPHGWQPYIAGKSVWNMLDETKFSAAGIDLPELSTKQYVQYGIGIQKNMFNGFYGYAQAMFRNGGRDGVALNTGLKMAF